MNSIGPGQLIFPVRLFAARTVAARRERMSDEEKETLGYTGPLPNGKQYQHGTMGGYVTVKCRCPGCMQWSADYGRSRKRRTTGRTEREWSAGWRRDPTEYRAGTPGAASGTPRPGRPACRSGTRPTRSGTRMPRG